MFTYQSKTGRREFVIPEGTVAIRIRGRHSLSVQEGTDETRTIRPEGIELIDTVRPEYTRLIRFLSMHLDGEFPVVACSEFPRSLITAFGITHAPQIVTDPRLKLKVSPTKAPDPAGSAKSWMHARKADGWSFGRIVQALATTHRHVLEQTGDLAGSLEDNCGIIESGINGEPFTVTFDHEVMLSLTAHQFGHPLAELGLLECQAFIYFVGPDNTVIGTHKFMPEATCR